MDENELKALSDIQEHGCHILQVMEEGAHPAFSYSIGIATSYQKPDLCVVGLKEPIAKFVINEYKQRVEAGEDFKNGQLYSDFLEGFGVCFEEVSHKHYQEFFGWGIWHYNGTDFKMLQLIYPTTSGAYPWSGGADKSFLEWQPILTEDGKTAFHK